ncbi:hypothetical protein OGAPHI_005222 [Ogataea philodendri]|uniref:Proteasome activator BLM10 n=1 Tax=Ogataea philodendri TaxID=1378263 RepID=A0A9P8P2D5_9ASCO|nr:uncharacterized protein OGAPHI_005222 [Ogataea philodendri]KAH3663819.1 hypothetical protein OGAPHI_005222 [Ogataea philodendri]
MTGDYNKIRSYLMNSPRESSPLSRTVSGTNMSRMSSILQNNLVDSRKYNSSTATLKSYDTSDDSECLTHYGLNVPEDDDETMRLQLDKSSQFYSTDVRKDLNPKKLLPYKTESIKDQYRYLSHVVSHLYIAIKSEDLKGALSVSVADLEKARSILLSQSSEEYNDHFYETLNQTESEREDMDTDQENLDEDDYDESSASEAEDDQFAATPVPNIEVRSAAIINLKHWTKELKNLLRMGLVIPVPLTIALVKVFYALILSRGQDINIQFYIGVSFLLLKEKDLLFEKGLRLDWRPFHEELSSIMADASGTSHFTDEHRFGHLVKFAGKVNTFFDEDSVPEIMAKIMARYNNQSVSISFVQMAVLIPIVLKKPVVKDGIVSYDEKDIRHYLPFFFSCWTSQRLTPEISSLVTVVANISDKALKALCKDPEVAVMGKYGIFTEPQFKFIMNQLLLTSRSFRKDDRNSQYIKLLIEIIINSMTSKQALEEDGIFDLLKTFWRALHTLIHPSNTGAWSALLSQAVKRMAIVFHIRLLEERQDKSLSHSYLDDYSKLPEDIKLSPKLTDEFIDILLPLIHFGVQSKSVSHRKRYITALEILAFINPKKILDDVLMDIYNSVESINSTHRINVVLHELCVLVRYMALLPVYRVHIPRLLLMLVPGIDSNDPEKTILTLEFIKSVAAVVPLTDLSNGAGDDGLIALDFTSQQLAYLNSKFFKSSPRQMIFEEEVPDEFPYDPEFELEALKSSSSLFSEFIRQFTEKAFKYLEFSPSLEDDGQMETKASVFISQTFDSLTESLSDELFRQLADAFYEYITNNVQHLVAIVFFNILELIIRRDPKTQFPRFYRYLVEQVNDEIDNGAGASRTQDVLAKDARLTWYLKLLSGTLLGATGLDDTTLKEIKDLILFRLSKLKGEAAFASLTIAESILAGTTLPRLLERRLISKSWIKKNGPIDERCWGGFQFDKARFDKDNLDFSWYVPSAKNIEQAVDFFDFVTSLAINEINQFVRSFDVKEEISLADSDRIEFNVNLLESSLAGICTLFDPNFSSNPFHSSKLASTPLSASASMTSISEDRSDVEMADSPEPENLPADIPGEILVEPVKASLLEDPDLEDHQDQETEEFSKHDSDQYSTQSESEIPSGVASPTTMVASEGLTSYLTGGPPVLFSFGYHFDGQSTLSNHCNPTYVKLHQARENIGRCLHELISCLIQQDGAVDLSQQVVHCIQCWLESCGNFTSKNPIFIDQIHLVDLLNIPHVSSPYSRTVIGARLAIYHCNRLSVSRSSRLPGETDKLLIKDLVTLAASRYNETAQTSTMVLGSALRKILNCTNLVYGIFKEWEVALLNDDRERLKNVLRFFLVRKFKGFAERSLHHFGKYEELLARSIEVNESEVNALAMKLYSSIKNHIKVPSAVCMIENKLVDTIKPPGLYLEEQVKSLKLAKDHKRSIMLGRLKRLESSVLQRAREDLSWKFRLKVLGLLAEVQSNLEVSLSPDILLLLGNSVNGIHPEITEECIMWLASILDATRTKSMISYDLRNFFSLDFRLVDVAPVSKFIGKDNPAGFFKEMANFKDPKFFIDSKVWVSTLCWNNDMEVVTNEPSTSLNLSPHDTETISSFGQLITKEWILQTLKLHMDESEANADFQPDLVYYLSLLVHICSCGYTPNMKYQEWLEICDEIYNREEKQTHVALGELYCALLLAAKHNPKYLKETDHQIATKLAEIFKTGITQSTHKIWKTFSWWLPAHFDCRRCPELVSLITNFDIPRTGDVSPFIISSRIGFLKAYMSSNLNRFHDFDGFTRKFFKSLSHPYQTVSERSASVLFDSFLFTSSLSFHNSEQLVQANQNAPGGLGLAPFEISPVFAECLLDYLKKVQELSKTISGLSTQEIVESEYMYHVRGLHTLLLYVFKTAHGVLLVPYLKDYIIPHLFELDTMKDVCQLVHLNTNVIYFLIASIRYNNEQTETFIDLMINDFGLKSPNMVQKDHLLTILQSYYTVRYMTISSKQRAKLIEKVVSFLYLSPVSVKEQAAAVFSAMIHGSVAFESQALIESYVKKFTKIINSHRRIKSKKLTMDETNLVHGATLGLGALLNAFPYTSPPPKWLPNVLWILAGRCSTYEGAISRTAKSSLSMFKKTRQDTWHIDSQFFTEDQLEELEGVSGKSYYL